MDEAFARSAESISHAASMAGEAWLEAKLTHLIGGASARAHGGSSL